MKLIRKPNAPIIVDRYGIAHPNVCIKFFACPEDKKAGWMEIHCGYFHNDLAVEPMTEQFVGFSNFVMRFDQNGIPSTPTELGWPDYPGIKSDIAIGDDGEIIPLVDTVGPWILNQGFVRDCNGLRFSDHWEIVD